VGEKAGLSLWEGEIKTSDKQLGDTAIQRKIKEMVNDGRKGNIHHLAGKKYS